MIRRNMQAGPVREETQFGLDGAQDLRARSAESENARFAISRQTGYTTVARYEALGVEMG